MESLKTIEMFFLLYFLVAGILFMAEIVMEYVHQRQKQITRYYGKPTMATIIRSMPSHLKISLLWPAYLTRYL